MVKYTCSVCQQYTTRRKDYLEKHLLGYEFKQAGYNRVLKERIQNQLADLYPHKHQRPANFQRRQLPTLNLTNKKTISDSEQISLLREQISMLQEMNEKIIQLINKPNEQQIINNNTNTLNVLVAGDLKICFDGQWNDEMLTKKVMSQFLKSIPSSAQEMFKLMFFNQEHPENHMYYLPNKSRNEVNIFGRNGWQLKKEHELYTSFVENIYNFHLLRFLDQLQRNGEIDERQYEMLSGKIGEYSDQEVKELKANMRYILVNNREIVKETYDRTKHIREKKQAQEIRYPGSSQDWNQDSYL